MRGVVIGATNTGRRERRPRRGASRGCHHPVMTVFAAGMSTLVLKHVSDSAFELLE